jgi:rod shape determining protein RodA
MNRNDPAISKGIDWSLIWIYLCLVAIGITAIFAVTYKQGDPVLAGFLGFKNDYGKQLLFFLISIVMGTFILLTDSKFFTATANIGYALGIFLLLLVFPFHSNVKGTESIIRFGSFQFQPAELCKIFVCLALAKFLSMPETDFSKPKAQAIAAGIALTPALFSIMQHETAWLWSISLSFSLCFAKDCRQ